MDSQQGALVNVLIQTGALGVVVYILLTQMTNAIKELSKQIADQNADLKVLLDRNVRGMEQVAREAAISREAVIQKVQEASQQVTSAVQETHATPQ